MRLDSGDGTTNGAADQRQRYARRRRPMSAAASWRNAVSKYKISSAEWVAIWKSQDGRCFICQKPLRNRFDPASEGKTAAVDHDHRIERERGPRASIRGLLCTLPCNYSLVQHWTPERLARAADYVARLPAQAVLGAGTPDADPESDPEARAATEVVFYD